MTYKEIRALIERRRKDWRYGNSVEAKYKAEECKDILELIDSLREEPVRVWHNMDEVPIKGEVIVVQTKDTFYGLSVQKGSTTYKNKNKDRYVRWAYASDLLKLSNIERTVKDWKEEPVSNNYSALLPCIYNRTLEERVKYCKYCSAACEGRVKEPVSEGLEEAVEIAREEMVEKVTNYLNSKLYDWVQISHFGRREYPDTIMKQDFIYDLKQAMKDE